MILIIILLILMSAFFSSAETALTTVNKMKIRSMADDGSKNAKILLKIFENTPKMLSAVLIGNNIVNISASSLMTLLAQSIWGNYAVSISTGILTAVILIFGEITPKTLAAVKAEPLALMYAPIIYGLMWLLTPVIFIINILSSGVLALFHVNPQEKQAVITENDLRTIVDVSHEEGVIESDEREMIKNVFDFGDACAKDIMIPRIDMCAINIDCTYDELIKIFKENKYTRFPVYSNSIDNIVGIINVKDILLYKSDEDFHMKNYLRQPYFTYEHKNLSDLMLEMKKASVNITIILDEYGAATGLITLEDLIEEIVGDIRDEYDYDEEDKIKTINENEYVVEGQMSLDDFNDFLGTDLVSREYDSIGGFIIEKLDRLAVAGDIVEVDNITLTVKAVNKKRIESVYVHITPIKNDEPDNTEEDR